MSTANEIERQEGGICLLVGEKVGWCWCTIESMQMFWYFVSVGMHGINIPGHFQAQECWCFCNRASKKKPYFCCWLAIPMVWYSLDWHVPPRLWLGLWFSSRDHVEFRQQPKDDCFPPFLPNDFSLETGHNYLKSEPLSLSGWPTLMLCWGWSPFASQFDNVGFECIWCWSVRVCPGQRREAVEAGKHVCHLWKCKERWHRGSFQVCCHT